MPWYVPIMASAGVALMIVSVWSRRGVMRILGLLFFTVICGLEWYHALVGTATPLYTGPHSPAARFLITARLADGTPFTEKDLGRAAPVLLFFRGRW